MCIFWGFKPVGMHAGTCVYVCMHLSLDGPASVRWHVYVSIYKNTSGRVRVHVSVGTESSPSLEFLLTSLSPSHGLPSSPDDRPSLFRSPCWPLWRSLSFLGASLGNPKRKWGAHPTWQQHPFSCSGCGQPNPPPKGCEPRSTYLKLHKSAKEQFKSFINMLWNGGLVWMLKIKPSYCPS